MAGIEMISLLILFVSIFASTSFAQGDTTSSDTVEHTGSTASVTDALELDGLSMTPMSGLEFRTVKDSTSRKVSFAKLDANYS